MKINLTYQCRWGSGERVFGDARMKIGDAQVG